MTTPGRPSIFYSAKFVGSRLSSIDWSRATEFSAARPRPVRWLVEEVIPADTVTLLSSVSGAGKSIIALNLALCILSGRPWLGVNTAQGNVAYWDQDNPDDVLTSNRIAALCLGLGIAVESLPKAVVFRAHGPVLSNYGEVIGLRDQLVARGITILIVDTLAAVNPLDEQGIAFSRLITHGLFPLVEAGITPIVLHHIGKSIIDNKGGRHIRSGVDAARGHSSLIASVGAAFNLMRDGNDRYIECVKPRYGQVPDIPITYDEDSAMGLPEWRITIGSSRVKLSHENLTHLIRVNGWQSMTSRQVVKAAALKGFSTSQSTATRALSESKHFTTIE